MDEKLRGGVGDATAGKLPDTNKLESHLRLLSPQCDPGFALINFLWNLFKRMVLFEPYGDHRKQFSPPKWIDSERYHFPSIGRNHRLLGRIRLYRVAYTGS